ncbi:MAG: HAD family hydrolase [Mycobacteriales bacterium]|nr:HAD family phosphatase [Frankia sp.]
MSSEVAVLFDLDGLLIDSEPIWSVAEAEVMEWLGGTWTLDVKAACLGIPYDESCRKLVELAGSDVDVKVVMTRLLERMCVLFAADLPWLPGARGLLDALAAREVPLALVSSTYRVLLDAALGQIGRDRFRVTIAGDEVPAAKPAPDPYLLAAAALGYPPARCVVLEDSPAGVASAEAAGCAVVAVPNVVPIEPAPSRHVRASLDDVDAEWLLSLATARVAH